jgi:8-oxo-dGTP pyrophosphatase MutT (NUDIX family)
MSEPAPAHPSATVVLLRDGDDGLELLLVRRNAKLKTHGGAWVFPGGRVDPADLAGIDAGDSLAAARRAGVRELNEEVGLDIDEASLVPMALWITPDFMPKRFATWFFVSPADDSAIRVDGAEIDAYRWLKPADALAEQRTLTLEIPPPTFVTITQLSPFESSAAAVDQLRGREPVRYRPRICRIEEGACSLYEGDAGYESSDASVDGPRHRLWIVSSGWRYECSS